MRKHSTVLWSIIIVVVIFAFVIWGTNPGSRESGSTGAYGSINGQPVTEEDIVAARNEVTLRYFLRSGEWPGADAERRGFNMQQEVFSLLLMVQELDRRNIHAGAEAKATVVGNLLRSLRAQGIQTLADFETAVLRPRGLSLVDLDRFIGHELAVQQLSAVEGLVGTLITPQQIESLWERENQELSAQVVFFSSSNYLNSIQVSPSDVATFFTNQMARYRIPDRIQVSYVAYPISNYFAQADQHLASMTNLDLRIDQLYEQRGTNFYPELSPAAARAQIREEVRRQAAVFAAQQAAAAFADELWTQEPLNPADIETLGAAKGLTVQVSEPFDRAGTPEGLDVNAFFTQAAFGLRDDEPFGGPIAGEDHVYVIALKQRLPSTNAAFEDVKDRVTRDYRLQRATLKARELGLAFANELTNGLPSGQAFTEICAKAGYKPELLPPFSRSTPSLPEIEQHASLGLFKQVAFGTPVGKASPFNFTSDGGYVVYVGSRLALDTAKMREELPRYSGFVRQTLGNEAFNRWFSQEAQVGLQNTPLSQSPPPQVSSPGT